jgi:hypothetical protein
VLPAASSSELAGPMKMVLMLWASVAVPASRSVPPSKLCTPRAVVPTVIAEVGEPMIVGPV